MSSLKARQAVQTCVLSTRWRHLWRSVPCLDVDIAEFRPKPPPAAHAASTSSSSSSDSDSDSGYNQDKAKAWDEFEDFAVNLLLRCDIAHLDSFRLDIDRGTEPPFDHSAAAHAWTYSGRQAAAWLRRAMKQCTPPAQGLAGVSRRRRGLNLSLSSSPWHLRRLQLCHVPLDAHFAEDLSSACPCLEDLELDHCTGEIRSIASGTLKNLVLKSSKWEFLSDIASSTLKTLVIDGGSNGFTTRLAISTPAVTDLQLDVDGTRFHGGISMEKMLSLDRASISLRRHRDSYTSISLSGSKLEGDQSELLSSVSDATSLELTDVGTTLLGKKPTFLEFPNLRSLLLGECDLSDDFNILQFFLRSSPNLKKVTLRHCKFPGDSEYKEGMHRVNKASCAACCVATNSYVMRTLRFKSYIIKMAMPVDP